MNLHQSRQRQEEATPDTDYVSQYKQYIKQMHRRGRMTKIEAVSEIREMEKNLQKADVKTRTKGRDGTFQKVIFAGIPSIIISSYSSKKKEAVICKNVDHYFCGYGDAGWGCGYRNFQMVCSYLFQYGQFKKALFGGCGFVPTLPLIQGTI
jgi:hypothetical protein